MSPPARFAVVVPVVPVPSLDYDPLKPFDEKYFDRAVDRILSEEADLEESRNEMQELDIESDVENDDNADSIEQSTPSSQKAESHTSRSPEPTTSAPAGEYDEAEDPRIFADVSETTRVGILRVIAEMPFLYKYPLKKSERLNFAEQIHNLTRKAGISQANSNALFQHVRATYMDSHRRAQTDDNGSAFGGEINDLEEEAVPSPPSSPSPTSPPKSKGEKRQSGSTAQKRKRRGESSSSTIERLESTPRSQGPTMANLAEVAIKIPDESPATAISKAKKPPRKRACADCRKRKSSPSAVKRVRIQLEEPGGRNAAMKKQQSSTARASAVKGPVLIDLSRCSPSPPDSSDKDESHEDYATPREHPTSPVQASPDANATIATLPKHAITRSPHGEADQPSDPLHSEPSKEEVARFKAAKNLRKRARRNEKKRRASMGLDMIEDNNDQPAQPQVQRSTSKKTRALPSTPQKKKTEKRNSCDLPGLTPSDEVKSKYFERAIEREGVPPRITLTPIPTSPIPQDEESIPESPTKSADCSLPNPRTPRRKYPKLSPYFPLVQIDAESCLPFPPIDAPSFGLIQEQLAHDPFRLLIATIFLNRTRGGVALPVLFQVFERYPTIEAMAAAAQSDLVSLIRCLGFQNQRATKCITLAQTWLTNPLPHRNDIEESTTPENLTAATLVVMNALTKKTCGSHGKSPISPEGLAEDWTGTGAKEPGFVPEWKCVLPQDKELRAYLTWMWLKEGWNWDYNTGDLTAASEKMMKAAQNGGVAHEEEGNWVLETSPVKAMNGLHS
ncbi:uncharacterized protein N7506_008768 [Penicillium brevicompactum]|uniref:uncharacterized protein n=1 Tax=Penicillium brevicompactum TaxID=5074 RepID=UPI0025413221|nr:uncharacterized protein N7506_008768 [Penicillium brevicompactum]KAJ5325666.1 hypothetical protein N7506_008768 [Penicillium brevicompactum]